MHWASPSLVAEVTFTEWTGDGQLRHPVFKGLREDKPAAEVVREVETRPPDPGGDHDRRRRLTPSRRPRATRRPAPPSPAPAAGKAARPTVGGVAISHPDRVVFPDPGLTKLDVAEYYEAVAGLMVPYLAQRALTVIRCPGGIDSQCFFQKNVTPSIPRSVSKARVHGADEKTVVYPVVDTPEGLLAMVQNGAVEFHVWGSRVGTIETPDILVFDLDPDPDLEWSHVREAARTLRTELESRGPGELRQDVRRQGTARGRAVHLSRALAARGRLRARGGRDAGRA